MADDLNPVSGNGTGDGAASDPAAFSDGADPARPAGSPRSYAQGGSTRWTPGTIADIQAKAQLGRYQIRGFSTFQRQRPPFWAISSTVWRLTGNAVSQAK